ncbi:cytochrome P450 [Hymenopellis radicata]|nr:cytochrome P450 [Hymenopellis radicata]
MQSLYYLALCAISIITAILYSRRSRFNFPLPPGPKGLPLIGNLFSRPVDHAWLTYTQWASVYGEIVSFKVLGQPVVIVNSARVANELFEKRSHIYSDRPPFHMAADLMKWSWNFVLMRYSDKWRLHRRIFHQYFQPNRVSEFHPIQMNATTDFFNHIRNHAGTIILRIIYGFDSEGTSNAYIDLADRAIRAVVWALVPGTYLVDYFPLLKALPSWFPFASFKADSAAAAQLSLELVNRPYELAEDENAKPIPCFVSENLAKIQQTEGNEDFLNIIRESASVSFAAGADTTVSVTLTVMLAMLKHPEFQICAHKELDAVVGRDRIPNFEDKERLPFVNAIFMEAMRWRPVLPLAIAHACLSDDVYEGYIIPGGALVVGNAWAILHDENVYRNAEAFNPDRFMGSNPEPDPSTMGAFGFSRRICPGRYVAVNSTYVAIASLLWAFTISSAEDENGKEIEVDDMAYEDGVVTYVVFSPRYASYLGDMDYRHPVRFKCKIEPRFPTVANVVDATDCFE